MITDPCQKFLEDPDLEKDHLPGCNRCSALAEALTASEIDGHDGSLPAPIALPIERLPMAPWESAQHRSWSLVAMAAIAILITATIFFLVSGISPLIGLSRALESSVIPSWLPLKLARHLGSAVQGAPASFHLTLACCFVVVNVLLAVLLKRAPKGIDASTE